jgi:thiol-disulfide isomerase/thioredoxin
MTDMEGNQHSLHDIDADMTVLYFWDSDCGHCKEVTPKLGDLYDKYKDKGMEVYAVNIEQKQKGWKNFVDKHDLHDWINVQDPNHTTRFRIYYDIYSTPVVYVLDENKEIIAKWLGAEQIPDFIINYDRRKKKTDGDPTSFPHKQE